MASNKLIDGAPRLGWLIDGNRHTPDVATMLQRIGNQVVLTVPFHVSFDDPYYRWFSRGMSFADDPDETKFAYAPPRVLLFADSDGLVVLVGCRASGEVRSNIGGTNVGHGRVVANYAVLGGRHLKFEKINGMQACIPALADWTGLRSVRVRHTIGEDRLINSASIEMKAPPIIPLASSLNLQMCPSWSTSKPDEIGTFTAHDLVYLQTSSQRPKAWNEHLSAHNAICDLISLSAWKSFGYTTVRVQRGGDSVLQSPTSSSSAWREVVSDRIRSHVNGNRRPQFLFSFDDIGGAAGVRKWLKLRKRFARAFDALLGTLHNRDEYIESRLLQSGIAIEALGYQLADEQGKLNSRGQITYRAAVDVIKSDMPSFPLDDFEKWRDLSCECYMSVKHADRPRQDLLDIANSHRENILVLRFWLALQLGCDPARLAAALAVDSLSNPYVITE